MVTHLCDRCGDEMRQSAIVTITADAPVEATTRPAGSPTGMALEVCPRCGGEVRTMLATKLTIEHAEPVILRTPTNLHNSTHRRRRPARRKVR